MGLLHIHLVIFGYINLNGLQIYQIFVIIIKDGEIDWYFEIYLHYVNQSVNQLSNILKLLVLEDYFTSYIVDLFLILYQIIR
jgi:hypothetical protein